MKLFSHQTIANQQNSNQHNQPINNMIFRFKNKSQPIVQQPIVQQPIVQQPIVQQPTAIKVKWGEPTWYLLHVLSIKVKEYEFNNIRIDLLNRIYAICINLPCPSCSNHAKLYLDNVNFNAVQTKEELKMLLFNFHNDVNKKKGYPMFSYCDFNEKYSKAITNNVIINFMFYFSDKHRSFKLQPNDLNRSQLCITLKKWFNENIQYFDI